MRSDATIVGTLGSWCSLPLSPRPVGLLPGKTDRLNVNRGGVTVGCYCRWSCGVGCRVVLSGRGCGWFDVGGVSRGVRRVRRGGAAVEQSGPRGAGVRSFSAGDVT